MWLDGIYDGGVIQVRNANSASGASAHGGTAGTTTNPISNNGASSSASNSASSISNHAGNSSGTAAVGSIPQSLDQLLERQWEQGSQFLMEQAQHFDSMSHSKTTISMIKGISMLCCKCFYDTLKYQVH